MCQRYHRLQLATMGVPLSILQCLMRLYSIPVLAAAFCMHTATCSLATTCNYLHLLP